MAYRVPRTNYGHGWKVKFETYTDGVRKNKDIPKSNWAALGFRSRMTWDEAKARAESLNAQEHLKRHEERRVSIIERLEKEELVHTAYLNQADIEEFENGTLFKRAHSKHNKYESHWRACKRLIVDLKIPVADWEYKQEVFYDYFTKQTWSPSYVQKILYVLNKWGRFLMHKYKTPYGLIPAPKNENKERISDTYLDATGSHKSDPLTPSQLESKKSVLKPEHYNWLYLSIWFGLRPEEVDTLLEESSPKTWWVTEKNSVKILWVFQKKLKRLKREKRKKPIPCLRPEQVHALIIITSKEFVRPLAKTVRAHFGARTTCYAGRKGFVTLMKSFKYPFDHISKWMGHRDINRTWQDYTDGEEDIF